MKMTDVLFGQMPEGKMVTDSLKSIFRTHHVYQFYYCLDFCLKHVGKFGKAHNILFLLLVF
jgi:hypothetical protein